MQIVHGRFTRSTLHLRSLGWQKQEHNKKTVQHAQSQDKFIYTFKRKIPKRTGKCERTGRTKWMLEKQCALIRYSQGGKNISRAVKYEIKMSSMSLGEGIIQVTYSVMLLPCDVHCLKSLESFRKGLPLNGKFILFLADGTFTHLRFFKYCFNHQRPLVTLCIAIFDIKVFYILSADAFTCYLWISGQTEPNL